MNSTQITAKDLIGLINDHVKFHGLVIKNETQLNTDRSDAVASTVGSAFASVLLTYYCLPMMFASCYVISKKTEEFETNKKTLYDRSMAIYKFLQDFPCGVVAPHNNQEQAFAFCLPTSSSVATPKCHAALVEGRLFIALPFSDESVTTQEKEKLFTDLFSFAMEEAMKAKAELLTFSIADKSIRSIINNLLLKERYNAAFKKVWIITPNESN